MDKGMAAIHPESLELLRQGSTWIIHTKKYIYVILCGRIKDPPGTLQHVEALLGGRDCAVQHVDPLDAVSKLSRLTIQLYIY